MSASGLSSTAPPQSSAIYTGRVVHKRLAPAPHALNQPLAMFYLDLAELPRVLEHGLLASASHTALIRFRRGDYIGKSSDDLAGSVRAAVQADTGVWPRGPVRVLTHLSFAGFCFNPVSFYYVFAPDGETVEFIVAEITNTPWHERFRYVLDCRGRSPEGGYTFEFDKAFHVSPFMPMHQRYRWRLWHPDDRMRVHMENFESGRKTFSATMVMRREALTRGSLAAFACKYPMMTAQVVAGIYWNALKLWWKRIPFHSHPKHIQRPEVSS